MKALRRSLGFIFWQSLTSSSRFCCRIFDFMFKLYHTHKHNSKFQQKNSLACHLCPKFKGRIINNRRKAVGDQITDNAVEGFGGDGHKRNSRIRYTFLICELRHYLIPLPYRKVSNDLMALWTSLNSFLFIV